MVESVVTRCVVEDADSAGSVASKSPALFMLRALCQLHRRAPQELVSERCPSARSSQLAVRTGRCVPPEVGAFYWTDMAPDIVNPGREEQGSVSV